MSPARTPKRPQERSSEGRPERGVPAAALVVERAFDPETFRSDGHRLVDQLASYLERAMGRGLPVLRWVEPSRMVERWPARFPESPEGELSSLLARVTEDAIHLHQPHYTGHQVTSPLPLAALCELAGALLNNAMAVYEMGPGVMAMERSVLAWMAERLGWGPAAGGVLTSGGSVGNLTALLAARQAKAGFDAWGEGPAAGPALAVLAADQAHYSVDRAVRIMGWGRDGLVRVPVDARFRMRPEKLEEASRSAERAGRKVVAVVASACSTATGAFDPLDAIADFCQARGLWLHVDGAHGASAALSDKYRPLLRGVERADSVVWDAHKLMLMPALVTAVLYRDGDRSYDAFAQEASYLFHAHDPREEWFNVGLRTLECTKRMLAFPLYAALSVYGTRFFADYVTATFDLARRFADLLRSARDFELAVEPECNIVCFRYRPAAGDRAGSEPLDDLQAAIRRRLLDEGRFYIVQTRLPAGVHLRTVLLNPLTTVTDLEALLDAVRAAAAA